ncbi:hypothetical protein D3C75_618820 [compost metagenome]
MNTRRKIAARHRNWRWRGGIENRRHAEVDIPRVRQCRAILQEDAVPARSPACILAVTHQRNGGVGSVGDSRRTRCADPARIVGGGVCYRDINMTIVG